VYTGTLQAQGTAANPILFTSHASTPSPGNWGGIYVEYGGNVTLDHVTIEYASTGVTAWGDSLSLTNSTIRYNDYGLDTCDSSHAIRYNEIHNNAEYALSNSCSGIVDARHNWWGSADNPADQIAGPVLYDPWIGKQAQESEDLIDDALPDDPIRNTASPEPGVPYIESVDTSYGHVFLGNVNLDNRYTVQVDWNGSDAGEGNPGKVTFKVNGKTAQETGESWGAEHTYNVHDDFANGFNQIEIMAYNAEGTASRPMILSAAKFVIPEWLDKLGVSAEIGDHIKITYKVDYLEFSIYYDLPSNPFKADVTVPSWFPYFGGKELGAEAQGQVDLKLRSDATGSVTLGGEAAFKAADQEIGGSIEGTGAARLSEHGRIEFTEAKLDFGLWGTLRAELPLLELIPQVAALSNTPVVGGVIGEVTKKLQVYASISPDVNFTSTWGPTADEQNWEWKGGEGDTGLSTELGLKAEIVDGVEARLYGSGSGQIYFEVPHGESPSIKSVEIDLWAGAEFSAWGFGPYSRETDPLHWSTSGTRMQVIGPGLNALQPSTTAWRAREYDYGDQPYAVFVGDQLLLQDIRSIRGTRGVTHTSIMLNVYPESRPALAAQDSTPETAVMVWMHDDTGEPAVRSKEILASRWDGLSWSAPFSVTNNTMSDYNPQVAFDGSGHAVAVWEQINDPALPVSTTLDVTLTKKFEIAYSVYDVASDSWNTPQKLTSNTAFDHRSLLAAGDDGQIMLVWTSNPGGYLIGDGAYPDAFYSAVWDGSAWSTPTLITDTITGTLRASLAYQDGTHAVLVLSRDLDGDWTTPNDIELFYSTWDGTAWSSLSRLTNDDVNDERPMVLYTSAGEKRLVWLKGNQIYLLHDDWSAAPTPTTISGDMPGLLDFDVTLDTQDNLALIWQGTSQEVADMFYAIYDDVSQQWSVEAQLTEDQAVENEMAPTFTPEGTLMVAYAREALKYDDRVISPTLTLTDVLQPDHTDLYVLHYMPDTDLTLTDFSLPQYFANPWPGDSMNLYATVQNTGDWAVTSPTLAFYDGDPAAGGILITTTLVISGPLAGGASEQVSIRWTVPVTPVQSHTLHAILDPSDLITEADETNNVISLTTTLPDLAVSSVKTYYYDQQQVIPLAVIANNGPITATNILVEFRENTVTGTVRHSDTITQLVPYDLVAITTTWDVSAWSGGDHTYYAVVDSGNAITEVDESDNNAVFPVKVMPDLVIYSGDVQADLDPVSGGPVTVTVHNWGTADVADATVTLYEGPTITASVTALYTWTVPSLALDGDTTLNMTLDHRPNRLFAIADPGRVITEVEESNNAALLIQPISVTWRYHDLEGRIPSTATVTLNGHWTTQTLTMTKAADIYSITLNLAETPLHYRYIVDGDPNLLNIYTRTVTPTVATTYDDYLAIVRQTPLNRSTLLTRIDGESAAPRAGRVVPGLASDGLALGFQYFPRDLAEKRRLTRGEKRTPSP
ncbi:hypothetical protein GF373_17275, partial [bacterium]|nr:hypothetical protein [bacterium]